MFKSSYLKITKPIFHQIPSTLVALYEYKHERDFRGVADFAIWWIYYKTGPKFIKTYSLLKLGNFWPIHVPKSDWSKLPHRANHCRQRCRADLKTKEKSCPWILYTPSGFKSQSDAPRYKPRSVKKTTFYTMAIPVVEFPIHFCLELKCSKKFFDRF